MSAPHRHESRLSERGRRTACCCGGGRGKGGTATLSVNGGKGAEGRIANTNGLVVSADEGADVGVDEGTPVTDAYKAHDNRFAGRIHKVIVEVK